MPYNERNDPKPNMKMPPAEIIGYTEIWKNSTHYLVPILQGQTEEQVQALAMQSKPRVRRHD